MNKTIKKLPARRGHKRFITSLDLDTSLKLDKIKDIHRECMNLEVSNGILVRRSIHYIYDNFYDDLITKSRTERKEKLQQEAFNLKCLSS